ncbi:hypothetical protein NECAME_12952 [Necator americanus]|uniref:Uncharacterized protein n=1 Tax=Necator americanus TaxID=51031 RepID=W2SY50_NECAM|nr:hypothetical protein NECAME_12952 [Necator americanus]ETN74468.1 hypothetical protein NECAME_12952 [Necator americanus]
MTRIDRCAIEPNRFGSAPCMTFDNESILILANANTADFFPVVLKISKHKPQSNKQSSLLYQYSANNKHVRGYKEEKLVIR